MAGGVPFTGTFPTGVFATHFIGQFGEFDIDFGISIGDTGLEVGEVTDNTLYSVYSPNLSLESGDDRRAVGGLAAVSFSGSGPLQDSTMYGITGVYARLRLVEGGPRDGPVEFI